jgi:hypothetical protein
MTRLSRRLLLLAATALAALAVCATAGANADPASDYLITQPVFFPFESKVSDENQDSLTRLLEAAKDDGFEIKVALIATRGDLGGVPVLYRKPQTYADFLGQELVYYWKGPLLVVMPNGYGVFQTGKPMKEDKAVLAKLTPPGTTDGNVLAQSAETAVRALAQRRGITLPAATADVSSSSTNRDRVTILAGAVLLGGLAFAVRLVLGRRHGDHRARA